MTKMSYLERAERFDAALSAAVSANDSDQVLAGMLSDQTLDTTEHTKVAAALGTTRGAAGSAALRKAFSIAMKQAALTDKRTNRGERDLICACVIALARRDGPDATDIYLVAARHTNSIIRDYGSAALAPSGDDRAWEEILARLDAILQRKISPDGLRWEEAVNTIEYLARHASRGSTRATRLITLLRSHWRNLASPGLLQQWWPGIGPGGPPPQTIDLGAHTIQHSW